MPSLIRIQETRLNIPQNPATLKLRLGFAADADGTLPSGTFVPPPKKMHK